MPRPRRRAMLLCLALLTALSVPPPTFEAVQAFPEEILVKRPERRGGGGRVPFSADPIALQMARNELGVPKAGQDGWEAVQRAEDGSYPVRGGSYAAMIVKAEEPATMLLKASGHGMVYVNGEPRAGDPYGYGFLHLPVKLQAGENLFLFQHGRGSLRAELAELPGEVFVLEGDVTSPDFLLGRDETLPVGVVVANATDEPVTAAPWSSAGEDEEHARIEGAQMTVPAMSVRKVVFPVHYDGREGESLRVTLGFGDHEGATRQIELAIRQPGQMYKRTFISRIDGSVQYYAIQPRTPVSGGATGSLPASAPGAADYPDTGGQAASGTAREGEAADVERPALVLSLHGASVEATNQAAAYAPKAWCDIVCPTNRRPFGFDWEEWGRIDAMEVLDDAMRHLNSDPSRVYLTGHSMGGHGTWSVAAHHPDRFAAIGPSAGWLSFATYGGAGHPQLFEHTEGVAGIFARAARASDTSLLLPNLRGKGIYILHGDADDNVPVSEARQIGEKLRELGIPFESHEQPGAGHWWENSDEPGAECVDWPAMFDIFARHRLPDEDEVRTVEFVTTNVGDGARNEWVTVCQQIEPGKSSAVSLRYDPHTRSVTGTTENVRHLGLHLAHEQDAGAVSEKSGATQPLADPSRLVVRLDGETIETHALPQAPKLHELLYGNEWKWRFEFAHRALTLQQLDGVHFFAPAGQKHPLRSGPFKHAFDHNVVFVYGTKGTPEETGWARAKARYDAESFYYRGNGSIAVVADTAFDPEASRDHSVILYGNADTHEDWAALLGEAPVELRRGHVKVGDVFAQQGEDRGIVFCYPRYPSERALVGVVGGTGLLGMRLTDRLPYFTSGVHYPDWTVFGPAVYESGYEAADAAGYFDNAWQVDPANSATRAEPLPDAE